MYRYSSTLCTVALMLMYVLNTSRVRVPPVLNEHWLQFLSGRAHTGHTCTPVPVPVHAELVSACQDGHIAIMLCMGGVGGVMNALHCHSDTGVPALLLCTGTPCTCPHNTHTGTGTHEPLHNPQNPRSRIIASLVQWHCQIKSKHEHILAWSTQVPARGSCDRCWLWTILRVDVIPQRFFSTGVLLFFFFFFFVLVSRGRFLVWKITTFYILVCRICHESDEHRVAREK